jgi:hypothetical protein
MQKCKLQFALDRRILFFVSGAQWRKNPQQQLSPDPLAAWMIRKGEKKQQTEGEKKKKKRKGRKRRKKGHV